MEGEGEGDRKMKRNLACRCFTPQRASFATQHEWQALSHGCHPQLLAQATNIK